MGKPEIVSVSKGSPQEILTALAVGPQDILVLAPQVPFAALGESTDVSIDAVRNEAQKAILAIELARRIPTMLLLKSEDAAEWSKQIAELLGVSLSVAQSLADPVSAEVAARAERTAISAFLSSSHGPLLLRTYLAPLLTAAAHPASIVVAWPRDCFLYGDAPGEGLPETVEVAGRARILAYGPYMPLPMGRWRATACLGFSPDIGSMPFMLEADTDIGITRGFFEVKLGGIFTLDLDFDVTDPFHPVEFRLVSQDSALEGLVSLIEVKLEKI